MQKNWHEIKHCEIFDVYPGSIILAVKGNLHDINSFEQSLMNVGMELHSFGWIGGIEFFSLYVTMDNYTSGH